MSDLRAVRAHHRKKHAKKLRWLPVGFRKPHPAAAACVLLALGSGLRRNECDKARWSWLKFDGKGDAFIQIAEESDFKPKGGTLRLIKIPRELHDALTRTRVDLASPYILGGQESPARIASGEGYRRPETFRAVNQWLRAHGVEGKNPLHRMRKQFGSELATEFGLFTAQKLLGHSSPTVTAKYYAAQTELPTLTHVRTRSTSCKCNPPCGVARCTTPFAHLSLLAPSLSQVAKLARRLLTDSISRDWCNAMDTRSRTSRIFPQCLIPKILMAFACSPISWRRWQRHRCHDN